LQSRFESVATARSEELRALARQVADRFPPEVVEVVLTGSVSRGVADQVSDIELLVVTEGSLELEDAFELARIARLDELDTWGTPGKPAKRVSGYLEGEPFELVFWPRDHAESSVEALLAGEVSTAADALANGVALRTSGLLSGWQARLRDYPEELAAARIESAAERWGGYTPAALLTVARSDDRLALIEWLLDAALRVLTIVYALNRVWEPTTKRLAARVEELAVKPERLAERIAGALATPDQRHALLTMAELQLETVQLAPSGPNVDRARRWLAQAIEALH
jgi:predicted nucleotidyltransferase